VSRTTVVAITFVTLFMPAMAQPCDPAIDGMCASAIYMDASD